MEGNDNVLLIARQHGIDEDKREGLMLELI